VGEFARRHLTVAAADSVIGRDELCNCCRGGRLMLTRLLGQQRTGVSEAGGGTAGSSSIAPGVKGAS